MIRTQRCLGITSVPGRVTLSTIVGENGAIVGGGGGSTGSGSGGSSIGSGSNRGRSGGAFVVGRTTFIATKVSPFATAGPSAEGSSCEGLASEQGNDEDERCQGS